VISALILLMPKSSTSKDPEVFSGHPEGPEVRLRKLKDPQVHI